MQHDTKNVTAKEARKTALLVAGVLGLIALFLWYRGRTTAPVVLGAVAAVLVIVGFLLPRFAILFHRGWMRFAYALGYVNSRILLTLVYFLIFVPYGIISTLASRDPLDLRAKDRTTYWHKRKLTRQPKERFERLF